MENFLLPDMIELFETNRMSHFPPVCDDFFRQKFNFKDWICHSAVICGPKLCRRDGIMKARLETNIGGYHLRLVLLLFRYAYFDGAELILSYENTNKESSPNFSVFFVFSGKRSF